MKLLAIGYLTEALRLSILNPIGISDEVEWLLLACGADSLGEKQAFVDVGYSVMSPVLIVFMTAMAGFVLFWSV